MAEALIDIYLIVGNALSAASNKDKAKAEISSGPERKKENTVRSFSRDHWAMKGPLPTGLIFLNARDYKGRAISLAGDELTFDQFAQIFKEKTWQYLPSTFAFLCAGMMAMVKDSGYMFRWFHDEGFAADIEEGRKAHPGLKEFATWLKAESKFETK